MNLSEGRICVEGLYGIFGMGIGIICRPVIAKQISKLICVLWKELRLVNAVAKRYHFLFTPCRKTFSPKFLYEKFELKPNSKSG